MESLIKQSSIWLQREECRSGSIQDRTNAVLTFFKQYVRDNRADLEDKTGLTSKQIIDVVVLCQTNIGIILNAYLRGLHYVAVKSSITFISDLNTVPLNKGMRLYKARSASSNYMFPQNEMFHLPYNLRSKIANYRFSTSGIPCLYLGSSSYVCWEELGRVDFDTCNFAGFTNVGDIDLFDLSLPNEITTLSDVKRICITLTCSLAAKRDALFKEEYILPQCLFQALLHRHYYNHRLFGVRYISVHFLNGDADCFSCDYSNDQVSRFFNYVFPAAGAKNDGFSDTLKNAFIQTETKAMFKETLLHPGKQISGNSHDDYLDSQFGLMDALLDEALGFKPLRREGRLLKF